MLLPMPKVVLLGVDAILPNIPKDKLLLKLLIEAGGVCWRGMQPCHFAEAIAVQRLQLHTPHRGCTRRNWTTQPAAARFCCALSFVIHVDQNTKYAKDT